MLDADYDIDVEALAQATEDYKVKPDFDSLNRLTKRSEPARQEFLRRLNMPDGVTPELVKMREHLLEISREHRHLKKIDADFRHLFRSWFNRGFLTMRPLDWSTPANILEKVVSYEAVHAISNMEELRARLAPKDRFCYAFFHPAMEDEPLVFIEVALTVEVSANINEILNQQHEYVNPQDANCAMFYSISNCHRGLAGVSFGNLLIKQVVALLSTQFPNLKTFATLSPAPMFRDWLQNKIKPSLGVDTAGVDAIGVDATVQSLDSLMDTASERDRLSKFAAEYFLLAKNQDGKPVDPVARFHLNNGAELARLNFDGDVSAKGLQQSLGLMVNYVYTPARITENHENYVREGKIACDRSIAYQLK